MRVSSVPPIASDPRATTMTTRQRTTGTRRPVMSMAAILDDPDARAGVETETPDATQMGGHDVPRRRPTRLTQARPARRLVATHGVERAAANTDVSDATPHGLGGVDGVGQSAEAHHIATLRVVRIGMEEVVGHVFHHAVDLGARHLALPRVGVRQRGVAIDVLERDRLPGEDGDAPAKARRERDLGVGTLEERVEDDFVEGPVEVAATIEQRLRDGQALTE